MAILATMSAENLPANISLVVSRTAIGLAQGLALYLLYSAFSAKVWPATAPELLAPLVLVLSLVPLIAIAGLGNLRPWTLAIWLVVAMALLAGLGVYDVMRDPPAAEFATSGPAPDAPSGRLWFAVLAGLFIAHSLIVSGDLDRKPIASYQRYFGVAWKHGMQVVLAVTFVGVAWGLLELGITLFELIKVDAPGRVINKPWFVIPVTVLATAYAIHVTDVRTSLLNSARALLLILLSWLLPLMAFIACAFLVTLLFTGLAPLFGTHAGTTVLLIASAVLIFLVNAVYQDGLSDRTVRILRYAEMPAVIALVPLVSIAAYGLALRVGQYGWTPDRIVACACVLVAACYAVGYMFAMVAGPARLERLEATNVVTAFVILGVLLALFSPVADPTRISVACQVARLEAGRIPPDRFDFGFLRFESGRFGREALARLETRQVGPNGAQIAEYARLALARKSPSEAHSTEPAVTPQQRAALISLIYPKGAALPESFVQQDWATQQDHRFPNCLTDRPNMHCDAWMVDLDGDGSPEILVIGVGFTAVAFKAIGDRWALLGSVSNAGCSGVREALLENKFELATPPGKELRVAGSRLQVLVGCSDDNAARK
jgi:Domain of unknown function (DUF4153)